MFRCILAVLGLFLTVVALSAAALETADAVKSGTSPEDWAKGAEKAHGDGWEVVDSVSGEMAQILQVVSAALGDQNPKDPCKLAAVNLAFSAAFDAYSSAGLNKLLDGLKGAISDILTVGERKFADLLKDKGKEWGKQFIRDKLKKQKAEVYKSVVTKGDCKIVLLAIWDKAGGTYEVVIYGDCQCKPQATGMGKGPAPLRTFAVTITGAVTVDIDSTKSVPLLRVGDPKRITIEANCQICQKPAAATPPSTPAPGTPATPTTPGEKPVKPCDVKPPCKECMPIYDRIIANCKRQKEIDDALRDLAGQLGGNRNRQQAIEAKLAELDAPGAEASAEREAKRARLREELLKERQEARQLEEEGHRLGLELQALEAAAAKLAAQLKECEKTQCGTGKIIELPNDSSTPSQPQQPAQPQQPQQPAQPSNGTGQVPGACPPGTSGGTLAGVLGGLGVDVEPNCEETNPKQGTRGHNHHDQERDKE